MSTKYTRLQWKKYAKKMQKRPTTRGCAKTETIVPQRQVFFTQVSVLWFYIQVEVKKPLVSDQQKTQLTRNVNLLSSGF